PVAALLAVLFAGLVFVVPILALIAFARVTALRVEMQALRSELERLRRKVDGETTPRSPTPAAAEPAPRTATPPAERAWPPPATPRPPVLSAISAGEPVPVSAPPAAAPSRPDFVTSLGPKLLVATGALAFVVFLGLFVKYAWENDWIGPAGRVLCGAVFGLALVALGVRLLGRRYRPLGQGLAGAGLASLYVSAYGAHGFYDLISREAAAVLMIAITVSAVLLAARLAARL